MKKTKSQTDSSATGAAIFLTIFCIIWDGVVFGVMLKQSHIPFWFKSVFVIAGIFVTLLTLYLWWQRIVGGTVQMQLPHDPLPHGMAHSISFHLNKTIDAQTWLVSASIEARRRNSSSFGKIWEQEFPALHNGQNHVTSSIALPADLPSTASSDSDTSYQVKLILKADRLSWGFDLQTRPARANESLGESIKSTQLGTKVPSYTPQEIANLRKKWMRFAAIFALIVIPLQIWSVFGDLIPWSPFSKAKANILPDVYSTEVNTEPFDLLVTNFLINDWALRGRVRGTARVQEGELIVKLTDAKIRPMGSCNNNRSCDVKSIRLLLSESKDASFSTLAQSNELVVNAKLADTSVWQLPAELQGTELKMRLPAALDASSMRLKLEIRSQSNSTVYPQNGPYLNLHRALAVATGKQDPCESLTDRSDMAAAGCTQQLEKALTRKDHWHQAKASLYQAGQSLQNSAARLGIGKASEPKLDSLDDLLIKALKNENPQNVGMLLRLGASSNAQDLDHLGRSALGYAASANDLEAMQLLLGAGARPDLNLENEKKQIVTPLTQALRSDPAQAVELLLQKGASLATNDPQGWTPMHIAAYESAHQSIAVMVKMGGNVNEKTPAYR